MTASLFGVYNLQCFTSAGALAVGYRIYTYIPGTTTQKIVYTTSAATVSHTYVSDGIGGLYIALNARGELPAPMFGTTGGYDIALKTPSGATEWTRPASGNDPPDATGINFVQFGSGAATRTVQDKMREPVSTSDFTGAVANDSSAGVKASNTTALTAAIASYAEQSTATLDGTAYSNAGRLNINPGSWWFNARQDISRNLQILGASGPAANSFGATRLIFPDGDHGITFMDYRVSAANKGADGSILENVSVVPATYANVGATPATGTSHGVWSRVRTRLVNVESSGWTGNGFNIVATSPGAWSATYNYGINDDATQGGIYYHSIAAGNLNHIPPDAAWWAVGFGPNAGNANNHYTEGLRGQQNGLNGMYISGADVNASTHIRPDMSNNRLSAIRDVSFLGVNFLGAHAAANGGAAMVTTGGRTYYCRNTALSSTTTPGTNAAVWGDMGAGGSSPAYVGGTTYPEAYVYWSDNANARSVYLGCYTENGQPPAKVMWPSWIIGGLHGSGFDPASTGGIIGDTGYLAPVTSSSATVGQFAWTMDPGTGLTQTTSGASGLFKILSLGVVTAQLGPGGIKSQSAGSGMFGSTQDATEFNQGSATVHSSIDYLTSTAYTGLGKRVSCSTASGAGYNLLTLAHATGICFQVLGNGTTQNVTGTIGVISDAKLKENVTDANPASAWGAIKNYRWVNYTLKDRPEEGRLLGLIAQEAEKVSPAVVYETPDYEERFTEREVKQADGSIEVVRDVERVALGTVTKNVKQSIVTMQAIVALQQAMKRIEALEAQVATLMADKPAI